MKNRIRVLRAETRWSQDDLAQRCGSNKGTINRIENEVRQPSGPLMYAIAKAFGVTVQEVFPPE